MVFDRLLDGDFEVEIDGVECVDEIGVIVWLVILFCINFVI